jgi:hypothetical protein
MSSTGNRMYGAARPGCRAVPFQDEMIRPSDRGRSRTQ